MRVVSDQWLFVKCRIDWLSHTEIKPITPAKLSRLGALCLSELNMNLKMFIDRARIQQASGIAGVLLPNQRKFPDVFP